MILTLYKNCFLKDTYTEVFDPSVLERYLDRLENEFIEIDASYPTLNGSIQLDFTLLDSPFEFNYMKLEADNRTYYCFINAIDLIGHNLARVSYQMDIWSTYIGGMKIRNSVLGSTKYLRDNFGFLPIEYDTVEPIAALEGLNSPNLLHQVGAIVEFQTYTLSSSSDPQKSNRQSWVACLTPRFVDGAGQVVFTNPTEGGYPVYYVENILQNIISGASSLKLETLNMDLVELTSQEDRYYELVNAYMVPAEWIQRMALQYPLRNTFSLEFPRQENQSSFRAPGCGFWVFTKQVSTDNTYAFPNPEWKEFLTVELPNDYTNLSVGPYTNPIPLSNNGLDKTISLRASVDGFNFNLALSMDGQLYDITPFYSVEVPFTSVDAETVQLRRIADREKRNNAIAKIVGSSISFGGGAAKDIGGMGAGTPESVIIKGVGTIIDRAGSLTTDIWTGINAIQAASAAKYQTTHSQNIDMVGAINAYHGLTLFRMYLPYNEAEVEYAIDNVGYTTAIIISNDKRPWNPLDLANTVGYNPTRYHYINLYGEAPQNIVRQLEGILTRGTKIHYA